MKKILVGVFAHPDDESFGPSGSLYKAVQNGTDVHLLLATAGDSGRNCDGCEDLSEVRLSEWRKSGALIGASTMHYLGYEDGRLCNNIYLELADKIQSTIIEITKKYTEPIELKLLTFDQNGLSGHLDHIAISFITTFVYEQMKLSLLKNVELGTLKYFCICTNFAPKPDTSWIYMPKGRTKHEVDEIIDISDVYEQKLEIMRAHESQREDMQMILDRYGDHPAGKEECFIHYKSE